MASVLLPNDLYSDVSQDTFPVLSQIFIIAFNDNLNSGQTFPQTLQPTGGLYVFPTTNVTLECFSSSTVDSGGNLIIAILGLNANYEELTEAIILNGITPVNTINQFFRVNRVVVLKAANSINTNIGQITVRAIGTTEPLGTIPPGHGSSRNGVFTASKNHNIRIHRYYYGFNIDQPPQIKDSAPNALFSARYNSGFPNNHWRENMFFPAGASLNNLDLIIPTTLGPKATVEIRIQRLGVDSSNTVNAICYMHGFLERLS